MENWLDRYAEALGEDPVTPDEMGALLRLAREVAHRTEDRRLAPLSTFLAGYHAGRQGDEALSERPARLKDAVAVAEGLLPPANAEA
jgi:hypothetical protein